MSAHVIPPKCQYNPVHNFRNISKKVLNSTPHFVVYSFNACRRVVSTSRAKRLLRKTLSYICKRVTPKVTQHNAVCVKFCGQFYWLAAWAKNHPIAILKPRRDVVYGWTQRDVQKIYTKLLPIHQSPYLAIGIKVCVYAASEFQCCIIFTWKHKYNSSPVVVGQHSVCMWFMHHLMQYEPSTYSD